MDCFYYSRRCWRSTSSSSLSAPLWSQNSWSISSTYLHLPKCPLETTPSASVRQHEGTVSTFYWSYASSPSPISRIWAKSLTSTARTCTPSSITIRWSSRTKDTQASKTSGPLVTSTPCYSNSTRTPRWNSSSPTQT